MTSPAPVGATPYNAKRGGAVVMPAGPAFADAAAPLWLVDEVAPDDIAGIEAENGPTSEDGPPVSAAVTEGGPVIDPPTQLFTTASLVTTATNGAATGRYPPESMWRRGLQWSQENCLKAFLQPVCPAVRPDKTQDDPGDIAVAQPTFAGVGLEDICGPFLADEVQARAERTLEDRTPLKLANYLHAGDGEPLNPTPTLQNAASIPTGFTTALVPHRVMGELAQDREEEGWGPGIFHIPMVAAFLFLEMGLIRQVGNRYVTLNNWPVVTGPGYPVTGPAVLDDPDPPANVAWVYLSGPVDFAVGTIFDALNPEPDLVRRRSNRTDAIVERYIIHRVDPCGVRALPVDFRGVVPAAPIAVDMTQTP